MDAPGILDVIWSVQMSVVQEAWERMAAAACAAQAVLEAPASRCPLCMAVLERVSAPEEPHA